MADLTVFISYSSADRMEARAVRNILARSGCTVWLDVFDIRVSADLKRELGGGIAGADVLCLLLSPSSVASRWVAEEIARGKEEAAKRGLRIVPVLLRPCRPPDELLGLVMLDATAGIASPDVSARLVRAIVGKEALGDVELDAALQEALAARQSEMEAAQVLPELAGSLGEVREEPIRRIQISFRHMALPRGKVLAIGLEFDRLFSQPMWFLFAHYREEHTWPAWMGVEELDHDLIRSDGKRVDGRFQWFGRVERLSAQHDGTDLRDLPATFDFEFSGESWQPQGAVSSYQGGPTVPHLEQKLEIPPLATLIRKGATFGISLVGQERDAAQVVTPEENDLDVRIVAAFESGLAVTIFRSAHSPTERAILKGSYLGQRESQIEREAILGLYPRTADLEASERAERRRAVHALVDKTEDELSPEERRWVATLRFGRAQVEMFRVFGSPPPPGPARQELHLRAITECRAVCRLLGPLIAAELSIDDVGMAYWAAGNLAHYYHAGAAPDRARPYAEAALSLVREAATNDPEEPEYRRWTASALEQLAAVQASEGALDEAIASRAESIEVLRALHEELPNDGRRRELTEGLERAIGSAEAAKAGAAERGRWEAMASELRRRDAG